MEPCLPERCSHAGYYVYAELASMRVWECMVGGFLRHRHAVRQRPMVRGPTLGRAMLPGTGTQLVLLPDESRKRTETNYDVSASGTPLLVRRGRVLQLFTESPDRWRSPILAVWPRGSRLPK